MPELNVQSIDQTRLAQVFPLIRSATRVDLTRWEEFGSNLLDAGGGIVAVVAPDQCVHGVAAYRPRTNLRHQRILDVEVIVAFDLRGGDRVRDKLVCALEQIAVDTGCAALHFTVDAKNATPQSRARMGLERLGLKLETAAFVRELPAA